MLLAMHLEIPVKACLANTSLSGIAGWTVVYVVVMNLKRSYHLYKNVCKSLDLGLGLGGLHNR